MNKDEALRMALEALEKLRTPLRVNTSLDAYDVGRAIIAIKQALAAPVQDSTCNETLRAQGKAYPRTCKKCGKGPCIGAPKQLPAQPAPVQPVPVQEPVGYADSRDLEKDGNWDTLIVKHASEMREGLRFNVPLYCESIKAAARPAPVQEPVAWAWRISPNADHWQFSDEPHPEATQKRPLVFGDTPSSAAQPSVPLTDEQILNFGPGQPDAVWSYEDQLYFARAIEAAHGIKGAA